MEVRAHETLLCPEELLVIDGFRLPLVTQHQKADHALVSNPTPQLMLEAQIKSVGSQNMKIKYRT